MTLPVIALLGRKNEPTDAVEEYCRYVGNALQRHDADLQIRRVPSELHGWRRSFRALKLQAADRPPKGGATLEAPISYPVKRYSGRYPKEKFGYTRRKRDRPLPATYLIHPLNMRGQHSFVSEDSSRRGLWSLRTQLYYRIGAIRLTLQTAPHQLCVNFVPALICRLRGARCNPSLGSFLPSSSAF